MKKRQLPSRRTQQTATKVTVSNRSLPTRVKVIRERVVATFIPTQQHDLIVCVYEKKGKVMRTNVSLQYLCLSIFFKLFNDSATDCVVGCLC